MNLKPIHCLLLGFLALAGCTRQSPPANVADVLATVGPRTIRRADFEAEVARRAALGQPIPSKEALMEEMVARESFLARALELGLADQPEVRRRYENILLAELKERELNPRLAEAKISPETLRAADSGDLRPSPAQVRLAALRISVNARTSPEKRVRFAERLSEARQKALQLPAGELGFGPLAVDYSDDQSTRYRGGDLGWFDLGRTNYSLPPELLAAGQNLVRPGSISEVFPTEHGLFLVRLMERREGGQRSAAGSDPYLHQKLLARERKQIEANFAAEARAHARVQINSQALASLQLDLSQGLAHAETIPPALPGH